MLRRHAAVALLLCALVFEPMLALGFQQPSPTPTPAPPAQTPTPAPANDPIARIKDEGLNRSQVVPTIDYLTNVIGPRLTNSPAMKRANTWTRDKLAAWGVQNAHLEAWGPFGRGWTLRRFSAEIIEPQSFPLLAYPKAWSPGLDAPLTGEVLNIEAGTEEELQKYKGKLRGAIVLVGQVRELKAKFEPTATRVTDKELHELADAPVPADAPRRAQRQQTLEQLAALRFADRRMQFYHEEGVALLVDSSRAGDGGMLQFVQSAYVWQPFETPSDRRIAPWSKDAPQMIPQITLSNDHYNRLVRMIRQGERPRMSVNLAVDWDDSDPMGYNTIAEIPGSDLKDEVVMIGAHLDSWHTGTGATDNAAGVVIMMEAMRILQTLQLQPRRTVRIALWSGEEQGLLGSRFYVNEHFGPVASPAPPTSANNAAALPSAAAAAVAERTGRTPGRRDARQAAAATRTATPAATDANTTPVLTTPAPAFKPEHDKLNVYFNVDSGTGKIRGIYLQGNEALRSTFRQWLEPFREMGATTITVANAGGSDFLAFDAAGLVGLDFLQDEIEYAPRTWHSNQDMYDRILPDDLKQAAIVVAAFAYNAAMMEGKLPRKPSRAARPAR